MDACLPFAGNVRRELWDIPIKTACCRRAFLYGLLLRAEPGQADGSLTLTLPVSRDEAPAVRERVQSCFADSWDVQRLRLKKRTGLTVTSGLNLHPGRRLLFWRHCGRLTGKAPQGETWLSRRRSPSAVLPARHIFCVVLFFARDP